MDKVNIPRKLLEDLTNEGEPMNQDELGGCVWCGGTPPREQYGYARRKRRDHSEDCPWVIARELLGDPIPD